MRKKKHFKKKRQQPRPKSKRKVTASKTKKGDTSSFESQMKVAGKQILDLIKDKETLNTTIHQYVSDIEVPSNFISPTISHFSPSRPFCARRRKSSTSSIE